MSKPPRAVLYARCSTGHQDVGLQVDELRAVAKQRGLTLVAEFVEEGVSGATPSQPGFDAMMRAAQGRKFDHLTVWKLDRLGRSTAHLVGSLDLLAGGGVSFASVRGPDVDTTSAHGRLFLRLLAVFASTSGRSSASASAPVSAVHKPRGGTSDIPVPSYTSRRPWPSSAMGGAPARWPRCST